MYARRMGLFQLRDRLSSNHNSYKLTPSKYPYFLESIPANSAGDDTRFLKIFYSNDTKWDGIEQALAEYCPWFLAQLESGFNNLPEQYRDIGVIKADRTIESTDFQAICICVCEELARIKHVSLGEIAETLVKKLLVTDDENHKTNVQQMVFATIGLLSMLFAPSASYIEGVLSMDITRQSPLRKRASETWVVSQQPLGDATGSIGDILRSFSSTRGPISYIGGSTAQLNEIDTLMSSNLNFYTLARFGGLRIKWVDSVCMHLELNRRDKLLMVFRFPSLCAIMALDQENEIFLDRHVSFLVATAQADDNRLFKDYFKDLRKDLKGTSPAGDFYREVLFTYRLIFGQDQRS